MYNNIRNLQTAKLGLPDSSEKISVDSLFQVQTSMMPYKRIPKI